MKNTAFSLLICLCSLSIAAQNVGINTITPNRAKLEVFGVAGSGSTSGIFGVGGAGISIQQNWPSIGFNQYRDETSPGAQGRFMANGFAAIQYMDPGTGVMAIDMFPSGTSGSFTPVGIRAMTFFPTGNVGIRAGIANASLAVLRGDGIEGTAVFQGSIYSSQFNYNFSEDTYIRPGKDSSKVYLSNLTGGDVLIGNGNTRLFINRPVSSNSSTVEIKREWTGLTLDHLSLVDINEKSWSQDLRLELKPVTNGVGFNLGFLYENTYKNGFYWATGNYHTFSDHRLKNSILPMEPVLSKLKQLTPVSYEMTAENPDHIRSIGFIAQDVRKLFPGAVRVISDFNRKGPVTNDLNTMNYKYFGVLAIQALKEQWQQLKALEEEQASLLIEIEALQKQASALSGKQ